MLVHSDNYTFDTGYEVDRYQKCHETTVISDCYQREGTMGVYNQIIRVGFTTCFMFASLAGCETNKSQDLSKEPAQEISQLDSFLRESKQQGKPLLIYFHADWCSPCQALKKVFADPKVNKILTEEFVFQKVDADNSEGEKLADQLKVKGLPTMLLIDSDGNIQERVIQGYASAQIKSEDFAEQLKQLLSGKSLAAQLEDKYRLQTEFKEKLKAVYVLINHYASQGNEEKALEWLVEMEKLDPNDENEALSISYYIIASELYEKSQPEKAREFYQKIIDEYPKSAVASNAASDIVSLTNP